MHFLIVLYKRQYLVVEINVLKILIKSHCMYPPAGGI